MIVMKLTQSEADMVEYALRRYIPAISHNSELTETVVDLLLSLTRERAIAETRQPRPDKQTDSLKVTTNMGRVKFRGVMFHEGINEPDALKVISMAMSGEAIKAIKTYRSLCNSGLKETADVFRACGLWG